MGEIITIAFTDGLKLHHNHKFMLNLISWTICSIKKNNAQIPQYYLCKPLIKHLSFKHLVLYISFVLRFFVLMNIIFISYVLNYIWIPDPRNKKTILLKGNILKTISLSKILTSLITQNRQLKPPENSQRKNIGFIVNSRLNY